MPDEIRFRTLEDGDVEALIALWDACGLTRKWNDARRDIAFARGKSGSEILVGTAGQALVSSIMVGHDGHRGSFYYVAVDPGRRRRGVGRATVKAGEEWLRRQGVWKVNLLVRQENTAVKGFYERLGYEINDVFSMGQRLL